MTRLQRNAPLLLPLSVLVLFLLATGRWGSYLGFPSASVFVTDVSLALTAGWLVARHRARFVFGRLRPLLPLLALAGWSVARLLLGGRLDLIAARDFAPYAYVLAALAACFAAAAYRRTLLAVQAALLLHLAWVTVTLAAPDAVARLPMLGGKVRLLELRPDFDGATMAVLACLAVLHVTRPGTRPAVRAVAAAVALAAAVTILQLGSRAGLLALAVGAVVVAVRHRQVLRRVGRRRLLAAGGLLLAAAVLVLPHTYVFDRLTAPKTRSDSAAGTFDAREEAWRLVVEDTAAMGTRLVIGSGFGPDFLDRSGAAFSFEGYIEKGVRAPHNFALNTLARTGLVGLALLLWTLVALGRAALALGSAGAQVATDRYRFGTFAAVLVAALGVASLVGVILESPFGAVPFWWASGLLLVGADRRLGQVPDAPEVSTSVGGPPPTAA